MLGFLSKVWELIKSFASDLFSAFLKIIDFTQGVGLKPVTGIVTTILSLLLYAILSVITLAVKTCSAMYKLTINPDTNLYSILFGTQTNSFLVVIKVAGLVLLFIILISNFVRLMTSPEISAGDDSAFSLVIKTIIAGILIGFSGQIINLWLQLVGKILGLIMDRVSFPDISYFEFEKLSILIMDYVGENEGYVISVTASSQIKEVSLLISTATLLGILASQLIRYLYNCAINYVMMNVNILLAPLAFPLMVSKRTSNSFTSWVRLTISQAFVVIINFVILCVVYTALGKATDTVKYLIDNEYGTNASSVVIWILLLYAILFVANRLPEYMESLGVPTGINPYLQSVLQIMKGSSGGFLPTVMAPIGAAFSSKHFNSSSTGNPSITQSSRVSSGYSQLSPNKPSTDLASSSYSNEIPKNANLSINSILSNRRYSSIKSQNGVIKVQTQRDQVGHTSSIYLIPQDSVHAKDPNVGVYGKPVTYAGQRFVAIPQGNASIALQTYNPDAEKILNDKYASNAGLRKAAVTPIKSQSNGITGMYKLEQRSENGKTVTQWAPVSTYKPDPLIPATVERVGDLDYYSSQMFYVKQNNNQYASACPQNMESQSMPERVAWLGNQFHSMDTINVDDVSMFENSSIILYAQEQQQHALAPVLEYSLNDSYNGDYSVVKATNGLSYVDVPLNELNDVPNKTDIEKILIKRSENEFKYVSLKSEKDNEYEADVSGFLKNDFLEEAKKQAKNN